MKLRSYISLMLLAVYLFAAGGAAYASLSCECVSMKARAAHTCCHHCVHSGDDAREAMQATCCGDRHSTEIVLYTSSDKDHARSVRCAIIDLPPMVTAACPCPGHVSALRVARTLPEPPHVCRGYVCPTGLRAPPVLA